MILSFLCAEKVFFLIFCLSFSSSASSTHLFNNHLLSTFLWLSTFLHFMLHLSHISLLFLMVSHSPSLACPWGQIGEVVKNQLNLTVWHYTVNLWVGRCCPTILSVTAQEPDGCLGCKPSDTIALAAPQSGFYSQMCPCETGFIGKGNVYHWMWTASTIKAVAWL